MSEPITKREAEWRGPSSPSYKVIATAATLILWAILFWMMQQSSAKQDNISLRLGKVEADVSAIHGFLKGKGIDP